MNVNFVTNRAGMCEAVNAGQLRQAAIHPPKPYCASKRGIVTRPPSWLAAAATTERAVASKPGGSTAHPSVTSSGSSGPPSSSNDSGSGSTGPGSSSNGSNSSNGIAAKPHTVPEPAPLRDESWSSGKWLALGGSVAVVLALTVFRREIAPLMRVVITNVNNFTDKSQLGEVGSGNIEALATLAAVGLTIYWSFAETAASTERLKKMEELEAQTAEQLAAMAARLDSTQQQLGKVAAELAAVRERDAAAELAERLRREVAAELAPLRRPQKAVPAGKPHRLEEGQQRRHNAAQAQVHQQHRRPGYFE